LKGVAHDGLQRGKGVEKEASYKNPEGSVEEVKGALAEKINPKIISRRRSL
jgi:hypothetical protein